MLTTKLQMGKDNVLVIENNFSLVRPFDITFSHLE